MSRITRTIAAAVFAAVTLAACGGGEDDSLVSAASYSQTAPAGSIAVAAGEAQNSASIAALEHRVGLVQSRVTITAEITNLRTTGSPSAAGARWTIRNGSTIVAQGPLVGKAQAIGSSGTTSHELTVAGNSPIAVEITGHVVGAGSVMHWDGARLSLQTAPL